MKKKDNYILLIIIVVILICILGIISLNKKDENQPLNSETKKNYLLLNDYSRFFTIESIVYKYINLITSNNNELINVLDKEYIETNNITNDNIYNYINKLDGIYSFKAKNIYYEAVNKNKYYVYGNLIKEEIDGINNIEDYYLIVNLDLKNSLFSITPCNSSIFKEAING